MHQDKIELSFLENYENLQTALLSTLDISKNQLKKYLTKKELSKPIKGQCAYTLPIDILNNQKINPIYTGNKVFTIGESKTIVAVHKPINCHSLPLKYSDTNCLQNYLTSIQSPLVKVNKEQLERGLLNRLDYETSGLILFAKDDHTYQQVRSEFDSNVLKKEYIAIVKGQFPEKIEMMNHLGNSGDRKKVIVSEKGELALASARCLDFRDDKSLVHIELKTGLRHQIRVQLSNLGFPILGDTLYGGEKERRLFLHSWRYTLNYNGEKIEFEDKEAELFSRFFDLNT